MLKRPGGGTPGACPSEGAITQLGGVKPSSLPGSPPTIQTLKSENEEIKAVGNWISGHAKAGVMPREFGLFVRSTGQLNRAQAAAKEAGVAFKVLDESVETTSGHISIGTMHLAKGLAS